MYDGLNDAFSITEAFAESMKQEFIAMLGRYQACHVPVLQTLNHIPCVLLHASALPWLSKIGREEDAFFFTTHRSFRRIQKNLFP